MSGLPDGEREMALQIMREHHISDADPLVALLALMRMRDSAFVSAFVTSLHTQKAALDAHVEQIEHKFAELKKDLAQTREAPRLVAKSVENLHIQTADIEKYAPV